MTGNGRTNGMSAGIGKLRLRVVTPTEARAKSALERRGGGSVRLTVLLCLALMSCTEGEGFGDRGKLSKAEVAQCKMKGGAVWYSSLADEEYCKILAADTGKACSKRSDCLEECEAETRTCQSLPPVGFSVLDDDGQIAEGPVE